VRRILPVPLLAAAAIAALSGCGSSSDATTNRDGPPTVYAAASLRDAFPKIDDAPTYSFGSSGTLEQQIERGAPADVFASASAEQAAKLAKAGRCATPVDFAANTLVLLVPKDNPAKIASVDDLRRGGLRVAIGAIGVPAGDYARTLLAQHSLSAILDDNRVSSEKDVSSVTAKVALGSADAGFVYRTDARATADRTRAIALPSQQPARYAICAVHDTATARAFIAAVRSDRGQAALRAAGFQTP
jgi:molybdate transport system substrate-binding protein